MQNIIVNKLYATVCAQEHGAADVTFGRSIGQNLAKRHVCEVWGVFEYVEVMRFCITEVMQTHVAKELLIIALRRAPPVNFFSGSYDIFLGYFDPVNIVYHNKTK